MLYAIFHWLEQEYQIPGAGLFQFITFRAGVAVLLSLTISMLLGGRIIKRLQQLQVGETVRDLGLDGQIQKAGTPTMGGVIIIMAILVPCILMADLTNVYIQLMLFATVWMGMVGFADDYIKVFRKNKKGLSGKFKVLGQVILGLVVALAMMYHEEIVVRVPMKYALENEYTIVKSEVIKDESVAWVKNLITNIPFVKDNHFDYGSLLSRYGLSTETLSWLLFVPLVIFVVTAVSNGANLTDGLDGLATGVSGIIGVVLAVFAYVSSNVIAAKYLNIYYLPGTQELVIYSACFLGACIGFLWYNANPAQVFMGDTGSLTIGGIIAAMAIILRKELLLPGLCGVFLAENLSVVLQVSYFKYTKRKYGEGKRIFLMSPLHHHYQKKGYAEVKIVTRFWIIQILLAVLTILTLKLR